MAYGNREKGGMKNDSGGGDNKGGRSTKSVGQGTGYGHKAPQKKASMAHPEGRRDPGQSTSDVKMKDAKIYREGPSTLGDMY